MGKLEIKVCSLMFKLNKSQSQHEHPSQSTILSCFIYFLIKDLTDPCTSFQSSPFNSTQLAYSLVEFQLIPPHNQQLSRSLSLAYQLVTGASDVAAVAAAVDLKMTEDRETHIHESQQLRRSLQDQSSLVVRT